MFSDKAMTGGGGIPLGILSGSIASAISWLIVHLSRKPTCGTVKLYILGIVDGLRTTQGVMPWIEDYVDYFVDELNWTTVHETCHGLGEGILLHDGVHDEVGWPL